MIKYSCNQCKKKVRINGHRFDIHGNPISLPCVCGGRLKMEVIKK